MTYAQSLWRKTSDYCPYQTGEKVWLNGSNLHTSHPMHKLHPKRFGPFEVTEQLSSVAYQLDLPPSWQIHNVFHATLLSPYHETREHRANYSTPAPEYINGEPKWEVAEVVVSRRTERQNWLQYLVRWVGYPDSHNSRELAENLRALTLICQFYKDHPRSVWSIKLG